MIFSMARREEPPVDQTEIASQIEHAACVPASMTLDAVYEDFRTHGREYAGVVEGKKLMGIVSRGHVGCLLGARYGFAIYGRKAVGGHMLPEAMLVKSDTAMIALLERALGRESGAFHAEVAIMD